MLPRRRSGGCDYIVSSVLPYKRAEPTDAYDAVANFTHDEARRADFVGLPLCMNHMNGHGDKPLRRIGTVLASAERGADTLTLAEIDTRSSPQAEHSSNLVAMRSYDDVSLGNAWWEAADGSVGKRNVEVGGTVPVPNPAPG